MIEVPADERERQRVFASPSLTRMRLPREGCKHNQLGTLPLDVVGMNADRNQLNVFGADLLLYRDPSFINPTTSWC